VELAIGANRFQRGLAGLLEFALEPWGETFEQFFRRVLAGKCGRDSEFEGDFLDAVGALEAEREHEDVGGALGRSSVDERVDTATGVQRRLSCARGAGALLAQARAAFPEQHDRAGDVD
jgi:hypothetical protein